MRNLWPNHSHFVLKAVNSVWAVVLIVMLLFWNNVSKRQSIFHRLKFKFFGMKCKSFRSTLYNFIKIIKIHCNVSQNEYRKSSRPFSRRLRNILFNRNIQYDFTLFSHFFSLVWNKMENCDLITNVWIHYVLCVRVKKTDKECLCSRDNVIANKRSEIKRRI